MAHAEVNTKYFESWMKRAEPGGPMWALNLMKYKERAEYADGRETTLTGFEADELYAPHEHLAAVGARIILIAPVVHQLVGNDCRWDRLAIAQYPTRMALLEMSADPDFQKSEEHKDAGMDVSIGMAAFPIEGQPVPKQESAAGSDRLMLIQVVGDANAPDLAEGVDAVRAGRLEVEDKFMGDHRSFAEARFDLISPATAEELARRAYVHDETSYAVITDPSLDDVARSLSDTTRVLF
jgi:hypothetical protein